MTSSSYRQLQLSKWLWLKLKLKLTKSVHLSFYLLLIIGTHSQSRLSKRNCHAVKLNHDLTVVFALLVIHLFWIRCFSSLLLLEYIRAKQRTKAKPTKNEVCPNISKSLRLNLVANLQNKHFCHTNITEWTDLIYIHLFWQSFWRFALCVSFFSVSIWVDQNRCVCRESIVTTSRW